MRPSCSVRASGGHDYRRVQPANRRDREEGAMNRKRKLTPAELRFISENQRLAGFSGETTSETAAHEVDLDEIAKSSARLGAQIPSPKNRPRKPRITRFGPPPG